MENPEEIESISTHPETTFIYVLIDPRNDNIRYVGKANNLAERLYRHVYDASSKNQTKITYKDRWLRELQSIGLKPTIETIEEVSYDQWEERECFWIDFYRSQGSPLTNTAKGGRGGQGLTSDEIRAKISAAKKGKKRRPMSEEGRRSLRLARKGRRGVKPSEETRAKLSASHKGQISAMKGAKHTPETRAKMSLAKKGTKRGPMPEETKRKIGEAQIGKRVSEETKARLSISHKGQPSVMKGRKMSLESRQKMSEAKKKMFAIRRKTSDGPTLWD